MSVTPSPIKEIQLAIQSENPFDRPRFLKQEDIWASTFPDAPVINQQASDAIFAAIEAVRLRQRSTASLFVSAERGLGKSHLISRIQKRLQKDGSAILVYMGECSNLDKVEQEFLHSLALSLRRTGTRDVMQWQEIAAIVISEVYKKEFDPQVLVDSIIPAQMAKVLAEGKQPIDLISKLRDTVSAAKPELDDSYLIQALLWTLSKPHANFAINWLAGRGLSQVQADAMGLPMLTDDDAISIQSAQRILNLVSQYKTVVICLDELDNPGVNQEGLTRAMVMAGLGKALANGLQYGVLITTSYPETFRQQIRVMPQGEAVLDRIAEKVIELEPLDADSVVVLVSTWLDSFYSSKGLVPPHPVYPFEESQLRQKGDEMPIIRKLLEWCADNFRIDTPSVIGDPPPEVLQFSCIENAFASELSSLEWSSDDYLDDKDTLSRALRFSFESLIGLNELIENVEIKAVEDINAKGGDKGRVDFRIVGKELVNVNKMGIRIGISIAQQTSNLSLTTTLSRLNDYEKFNLTRGCLVRSKPIAEGAKATQQALIDLLQNKGEWVLLMKEHIKPLLAVLFLQNRLEDYRIEPGEFSTFLKEKRIIIDNPLIREILSKPSGKPPKVPEDLAPSVPMVQDISQDQLKNIPDLVTL
jgi:hypothetical protein